MMREHPVQFYECLEVKSLHSTRRLVYCKSKVEAQAMLEALKKWFEECELELRPVKTRIVYPMFRNTQAAE